MPTLAFRSRDKRFLTTHGLLFPDVRRQARWLSGAAHWVPLLRPCVEGDGVEVLTASRRRHLAALARRAMEKDQVSFFVPASGAATRLFQPLFSLQEDGRRTGRPLSKLLSLPVHREARRFLLHLPQLAMGRALQECLGRKGHSLAVLLRARRYEEILDALLGNAGLGLGRRPKGLIPFHSEKGVPRTALEEHLRDGAHMLGEGRGLLRMVFTVSPEFQKDVTSFVRRWRGPRARRCLAAVWVQPPSTDTLALDGAGDWARRADGSLWVRPGGHGALLGHLEKIPTEYAFVRNIDNVTTAVRARRALPWRAALVGRLLEARAEAESWHKRLRLENTPALRAGAAAFVRETLGVPIPASDRRKIMERLNRPWRVCGVVRNTGEPGGGPFWVKSPEGPARQIVESQQVSPTPGQRKILAQARYFNPVDLVVAPRDFFGRPHPLAKFADPEAVMLSEKRQGGEKLRILERPGLWNGGMARWNTLFVEIPNFLFTPVKTGTDFLRPGHRS